MPEGMETDNLALEEAVPLFKDLNLPQEQAQKLVDFYASRVGAQAKEYNKVVDGWKEETLKVLGDDSEEGLSVANKFIDKFGNEKVREVLKETGLGNHPEVVQMFVKAGKTFASDGFVAGDKKNQPTDPESIARRMFPNTKY